MVAFSLGFEGTREGFGVGLARVVKGGDGPSTDVTNGPDDSHSGRGHWLGSALGGLSARFFFSRDIQTESLGRLGLRAEFQSIPRLTSHDRLSLSTIV